MKEIAEIRSANGNYFVIGKRNGSYYLKNKYTEIPNEFEVYDIAKVKELFADLCERVPECKQVKYASGHPNSCMYVIYSDKTQVMFQQQDGIGKNLCAYTAKTAHFSEFFKSTFISGNSELITLDHLRWVCEDKTENLDVLIQALKDFETDDYIEVCHRTNAEGEIEIYRKIYGREHDVLVTILPDGKIGKTGTYQFVELMKKHDVTVVKP